MRKHFPIYNSWRTNINKLSTEEKALLLDKLMGFYFDGEVLDTPAEMIRLDIFWDSIFPFIYENQEKYLTTVEARQENMAKARQSNSKLQPSKDTNTRPAGIPISTKLVSNDNDNDNDNDNVNDNVNVNVNDNEMTNMEDTVEWFLHRLEMGDHPKQLREQYPNATHLKEAIDLYFE